ncbi:MAG: hypothetical protein O7G87_20570, partial [bacterium]|nr:hypothetical protein [bacterium]
TVSPKQKPQQPEVLVIAVEVASYDLISIAKDLIYPRIHDFVLAPIDFSVHLDAMMPIQLSNL